MNQLRDNLKKLGLSPNHIFQLVKDSIGEDLAGGEDITSVATISSSQVSTADFTTRAAGVVSGLHVVAAVLEYCGITHYEVLVDEGAHHGPQCSNRQECSPESSWDRFRSPTH